MIKNITTLLVVFLLIGLTSHLWIQNANKDKELIVVNGKVYELLSREVEVVEVEKVITEYRQGETIFVEVEVPVEVFIPMEIDTMEVLKEYYSTRIYSDTLFIADLGYVALVDTVTQNKIVGRSYDANVKERTVTETITVKELPKLEIWAGVVATTNMDLGASVGVVTRKRNHIGVDLGIAVDDNLINPYIGFRYLWQIR